jgi:hypothetical protein
MTILDPVKKVTESVLFARIKNTLSREGTLVRLENIIIPGLPDCIFIYRSKILFIELKIARNGKISMPLHQWAMAKELKNDINPWHHWYFVWESSGLEDIISAYKFSSLSLLTPEVNSGTVKLDIRKTLPIMVFYKPEEIRDWLTLIDNIGTEP